MMQRLDPAAAGHMQAWAGLDISEATFDACLLVAAKGGHKEHCKAFSNTPEGHAKLLRWVQSVLAHALAGRAVHFCMEATGAYSQALALFLAEEGHPVSVVNPARVKYSGMGQGSGNKTDPADARQAAWYARKETPALWRAAAPEVRTLLALVRRLESLKEHLRQEKNRLAVPGLVPLVRRSIVESVEFLQRQIDQLQQQIDGHISGHPQLRADRELLLSIPGIGEAAAQSILAELPDVSAFASAQAVAAYAGLSPREYKSGTSVHKPTRITKTGNKQLRRALYMPALSAARYNPPVKELFDRLVKKGMARKAALCAAMRKLLMIAYGVLKNRTLFDYKPAQQAA